MIHVTEEHAVCQVRRRGPLAAAATAAVAAAAVAAHNRNAIKLTFRPFVRSRRVADNAPRLTSPPHQGPTH